MPIPSQIASAAVDYQLNTEQLNKCIEGLTAEEWLRQPNDHSNHILWIVGHVIWARARALKFLGTEWSKPWFPLFARGAKLVTAADYPPPEEFAAAWRELTAAFNAGLEAVTEETLSKPGPERPPSADGKVSGVVYFFARHETYHIGQLAYLRCWLGHEGVAG
jgi:uncharacterized damage-inducible protein DinB